MHKYYSPRWQHAHITLGASQRAFMLDPNDFTNEEMWDWHLSWISIAGTPQAAAGGTDWDTVQGGVARRVNLEIGMSQTGPINVVAANGTGICAPVRDIMVGGDDRDIGVQFNFPKAFRLPGNTGIEALVQNTAGSALGYPAIGFRGFEIPDRETRQKRPVFFGAYGSSALGIGVAQTLQGADLMNDGENTAYLTQMILGSAGGELNADPNLVSTSWRINPTSGIHWMDPLRAPIPAGSIAPFNQLSDDYLDTGPRAYRFPKGTILHPHRQMFISLTERSNLDQEVDICLFGMVEVS